MKVTTTPFLLGALIVAMFSWIYEVRENVRLTKELQWWRCERQVEQPPAPIAVDGPTLIEEVAR